MKWTRQAHAAEANAPPRFYYSADAGDGITMLVFPSLARPVFWYWIALGAAARKIATGFDDRRARLATRRAATTHAERWNDRRRHPPTEEPAP